MFYADTEIAAIAVGLCMAAALKPVFTWHKPDMKQPRRWLYCENRIIVVRFEVHGKLFTGDTLKSYNPISFSRKCFG